LNNDGLATLLVDLLTQDEEQTDIRAQKIQCKIPGLVLNKFNINLLADRLVSITNWISQNTDTQNLVLGYFGASTGSAAALVAAAALAGAANIKNQKQQEQEKDRHRLRGRTILGAIVSRGGRPDLAGSQCLGQIKVPTLLIVGANDYNQVISWNKNALKEIGAEKKKLVLVPNASHLFEEPGTLEEVARIASGWFRCYFQITQHTIGK
jgi:putative phosphoribosyl transferase